MPGLEEQKLEVKYGGHLLLPYTLLLSYQLVPVLPFPDPLFPCFLFPCFFCVYFLSLTPDPQGLPRRPLSKEELEKGLVCPICLEDFQPGEEVDGSKVQYAAIQYRTI